MTTGKPPGSGIKGLSVSIKPIKKRAATRHIVTYDLEWLPESYTLRTIGVFDKHCGYRHYSEDRYTDGREMVTAFLRGECQRHNNGAWFFAHAGGLYDMVFVLPHLIKVGWLIEAWFSGSSMVVCQVTNEHGKFMFCDSYFLLRAKLASIGEKLGFQKGECAWDAPLNELLVYNRRDCELLHRAVTVFEQALQNLGGELAPTIASCAMGLFRRSYMREGLRTHALTNDTLQPYYYGGRVEAFFRGPIKDCYYYDINSAYPAVMLTPLPANLRKYGRQPTGELWFADCVVDVPDGLDRPPLPLKVGGKLYFPTGRLRGIWASPELEYAESLGCRILTLDRAWSYWPTTDLADYARDLYERRMSTTDEAHRLVFKFLLNALYGKFGQREDMESLLANPKTPPDMGTMLAPGLWIVPSKNSVAHRHIPLAAMVTSKARVLLARHMDRAGDVVYCDTDSVLTPTRLDTTAELGGLKLELTIDTGEIVEPKFYRASGITPDGRELTMLKAKGYSPGKTDSMSLSDWEAIRLGGDHPANHTVRVKSLLQRIRSDASFDGVPWDVKGTKNRKNTQSKRVFNEDGTSRPYTVAELDTLSGVG